MVIVILKITINIMPPPPPLRTQPPHVLAQKAHLVRDIQVDNEVDVL